MRKSFIPVIFLSFALVSGVQAQKFGYCNSLALLAEMPEVKAADANLQAFQTQLTKRGEEMVKELQTKAADLEDKKNKGTISPKDYATQAEQLQAEQDSIGKYEQEVYQMLAKKREEEYKPILEKVNDAMKAVAKEKGYMLVFDSSSQILLYADESLDVTNDVKAKLGIPVTSQGN